MGRLLSAFVLAVSLDQVRSDPKLASDPAAIDALVRESDAMPPGLPRAETWMFAANAYAERLDRPDDAVPLWRKVAADPADPTLAHAALDAVVDLHLRRGEVGAAEVDVAILPDARVGALVRRAVRRRYVHFASIGVIAATLGLAIRGRRRGWPRAWPVALGFAAFVALGGAALATAYAAETTAPFLWFGLALAPVLGISLLWRQGPRVLRAAACAASVLAAAFLVLERTGQLEGLGL